MTLLSDNSNNEKKEETQLGNQKSGSKTSLAQKSNSSLIDEILSFSSYRRQPEVSAKRKIEENTTEEAEKEKEDKIPSEPTKAMESTAPATATMNTLNETDSIMDSPKKRTKTTEKSAEKVKKEDEWNSEASISTEESSSDSELTNIGDTTSSSSSSSSSEEEEAEAVQVKSANRPTKVTKRAGYGQRATKVMKKPASTVTQKRPSIKKQAPVESSSSSSEDENELFSQVCIFLCSIISLNMTTGISPWSKARGLFFRHR